MRSSVVALAVATLAVLVAGTVGGTRTPDDPFRWLENVDSPRALAWVATQDAATMRVFQHDPLFATNLDVARAEGSSADRIPAPSILAGQVYNFWQDSTHVRGIWRKTTVADYEAAHQHWTTVIDLDALAASEGRNWTWGGIDCSPATETRCLVELSEGGEDARTLREFDLTTDRFVSDGFVLPRGKQSVAWVDDDTLLVSREWRPGETTASGYPYIVRRWRRGQPLDAAVEVGRGERTDVSADPAVLSDGAGHRLALISRNPTSLEHEYRAVTAGGTELLALPAKSTPEGLVAGRILWSLDQSWTIGATTFPAGSLVSLDLAATLADPEHPKPVPVYVPGPLDTLQDIETTRDDVVITTLHNVRGRVAVYTPRPGGAWSAREAPLPDNATIEVDTTDSHGALAYLAVASFITPPTLWHLDTGTGQLHPVRSMPAHFDSSRDVVEQLEATSPDGTRVPYFVVHRAGMRLDGSNPTILYAYGGFGASQTPLYSAMLGRLWLARGGVYVLANIRGGGEFGPAWHEAAITTHRQRAFDDFAAVGRDLIARRITAPRHLGIEGGSNGGLLMGVEFTQHPDLWNAVDMQVPLLDMLSYEHIEAGASWAGEYGSVANPDQRGFLASISPYQNLKAGVTYPEPLIWTTTKDDRVGPQHARKFAAKLAALGDPYLFYEVREGGHGSGATIDERATTAALEYTYFVRRLMQPAGTP
ncbi:MAG: S9 family peptidase [Candidatus Dormibacteraeota bacterium]|nr:S9 family peptidase [Candidatus Dormibacteraeota bacterium]